ncbi:glycosyl hydrolase family 31 [Candidatus Magnetoovum chiemensis]|nr:glycosyl hydrolase family 31 [Candidatus Magnetoovum chiemensis]
MKPLDIPAGSRIIITIDSLADINEDRASWLKLSEQGLAAAYADDEPEYSIELIREYNPEYGLDVLFQE